MPYLPPADFSSPRDSVDKHADQINAFIKQQKSLFAEGKITAEQMLQALAVLLTFS